jgi:Ca2+-binding RTX toxin-like protein
VSAFFGSNKGEVITPESVSRSVGVVGFPRKPSSAFDLIFAGGGNDVVAGGGGDDVAFLGRGNDRFIWNPGDGSDIVSGDQGLDTLEFNGSAAAETIRLDAKCGLGKLTRDVGNIEMTLNSVERVEIAAGGAADRIIVGEIAKTDVREIAIDLAGVPGETGGDGFIDRVQLQASQKSDSIEVVGDGASLAVVGLPAMVTIENAEAADELTIVGLGGNDTINASTLTAGSVKLTMDGGDGEDTLFGSAGVDTLLGGNGDDVVDGERGDDYASLGAGNDEFIWDPGDGSDIVDGGTGADRMTFNGAGADEIMSIIADGNSAVLSRDVGNIRMDTVRLERFEVTARGGEDFVLVNDMTGTNLREVAIDLAGNPGQGDGNVDEVHIEGSDSADHITVSGSASQFSVDGASVYVSVTNAEAPNDTVVIETDGGNDVIDASAVEVGAAMMRLGGGAGDDVITGGATDDVIVGDDGNDILNGGSGNDSIAGGDGDDLFIASAEGELEITDFVAGQGSEDRIDLSAFDLDFDWLVANTSDVDGSAIIDLGGRHLTLQGVSSSSLHQDDFLL